MKKHYWLLLLIGYILLMVVGAMIPRPEAIPGFGGNTKIFHFLGFIVLAMLTLQTLNMYKNRFPFVTTTLVGIVWAYTTESLQLLVPTRHFLYTDMLIDLSGFVIGMVAYKVFFSKYSK